MRIYDGRVSRERFSVFFLPSNRSFSKFNFKIPDKFIDSPDYVQKAVDLKKSLEDHLKDDVVPVPLP